MEKDKIIIIALIIVIVALLIGLATMLPNFNKQDTNLTFKSKSKLTEGDYLKIKLTDANGTGLENQTVNITITNKDKSKDYHSVVTNAKGVGKLKLDKDPGKYGITITYLGDDQYNGCNATKKISIKEEVVEAQTTSSQSSSGNKYDINNLPPDNDPYPETRRYQTDEHTVVQEYEDNYRSIVDLRTGERHGGFF